MPKIHQIAFLILLFAFSFGCSNARYGHLTTKSTSKKAIVKTEHRTSTPIASLSVESKREIELGSQTRFLPNATLSYLPSESKSHSALPAEIENPNTMSVVSKEVHQSMLRNAQEVALLKAKEKHNGFFSFIGTLIVVFLFLAALAWLGTLFGIPFWTGMMWLGILVAFILIMDLLGISEVWMGK
ncbi:MAG: hypothetical protein JXR19_07115 [Bacteroidia bacterium]